MSERVWHTALECGKYFSKPAKTFYSLAARGLLPPGSVIRLGSQLRFDISAIEKGAEVSGQKKVKK
jgi:hypothetical protein